MVLTGVQRDSTEQGQALQATGWWTVVERESAKEPVHRDRLPAQDGLSSTVVATVGEGSLHTSHFTAFIL